MITTTLEQSKRLKELGAPQRTTFYWFQSVHDGQYTRVFAPNLESENETFAAYTLSELIEWLPRSIPGEDWDYYLCIEPCRENEWSADYSYDDEVKYVGLGNIPLEAVFNLAVAIKENK